MQPLVSIITATYNSAHILKYAILSLLNSDFQDWELIVIGDCCTDNTAECISSFNDERIRFINLEKNSGQQATPNNVGTSLAKGKYIAFLNQDDMYFKNHLSYCVSHMESTDSELICVPGIRILPCTKEEIENQLYKSTIIGAHPKGRYSPFIFNVASSWFFRRTVITKVGHWKMENELYVTPSQDWIFRAWKAGVKLHLPTDPGILILFSSARKNFYKSNSSYEHEYFFSILKDPLRLHKLIEQAEVLHPDRSHKLPRRIAKQIFKLAAYPVYRILESANIHPRSLNIFIKWGGKGKLISYLTKKAGSWEKR